MDEKSHSVTLITFFFVLYLFLIPIHISGNVFRRQICIPIHRVSFTVRTSPPLPQKSNCDFRMFFLYYFLALNRCEAKIRNQLVMLSDYRSDRNEGPIVSDYSVPWSSRRFRRPPREHPNTRRQHPVCRSRMPSGRCPPVSPRRNLCSRRRPGTQP